ncbi:MAG TPA: YciI family protein [Terrimesophilobacter sp.]|nr:YciI family protein [Terrimesophilobacter sp.]
MSDQYLLLIVGTEWDPATTSEEDFATEMQAHGAFSAAVAEAGAKILGGEALQPTSTGFRVTPSRDGKPAVYTNAPLAETTEVLGGYYVIEADSLDQVKELAALCPTDGYIEVRPIVDMSGM